MKHFFVLAAVLVAQSASAELVPMDPEQAKASAVAVLRQIEQLEVQSGSDRTISCPSAKVGNYARHVLIKYPQYLQVDRSSQTPMFVWQLGKERLSIYTTPDRTKVTAAVYSDLIDGATPGALDQVKPMLIPANFFSCGKTP
ncbi:MAG: hypothetical protein V4692_06315 [Bdellovibrionota bacterium]